MEEQHNSIPSSDSLRILVAEDSPVNRQLLVRILERAGHTVLTAENGSEAVNLLSAESVDVVLMDCQMPVLDGYDATIQIREREQHAGTFVPIIAVTAHVVDGNRERCLSVGMNDFLPKPISKKDLFAAIYKAVAACKNST